MPGSGWRGKTCSELLPSAFMSPSTTRMTRHASSGGEGPGVPEEQLYGLGDKDISGGIADTGPPGPNTCILRQHSGEKGKAGRGKIWHRRSKLHRLQEGKGRDARGVWNLKSSCSTTSRKTAPEVPACPVSRHRRPASNAVTSVCKASLERLRLPIFSPRLSTGRGDLGRRTTAGPAARATGSRRSRARSRVSSLNDGLSPSNEGRGYVLRRMLVACGTPQLLGRREPTLVRLVRPVEGLMGARP